MRRIRWLGGFCGLWAGLVWAQPPLGEAEAKAQAEVQTQRADGLIAVQPWVQVLGEVDYFCDR
jgi:hypothetical protein